VAPPSFGAWSTTLSFTGDSWAVAGAGDVNGDGFQDVILGTQDGSAVNVFLGTTSGVGASPEVLSPTTFDGWSGMSVR
jgi:hypothetical protein